MEKDRNPSPAVHKPPRGQRKEPAEPHTASSTHLGLPNPPGPPQSLKGIQSAVSPKHGASHTNGVPRGGDVSRSHGYSSSRRVRGSREDHLHRERPDPNPQGKTTKSNKDFQTQGRTKGRNQHEAHNKGFRSAPNSAGKPKPEQPALVPFEVKMTDFPELSGVLPVQAVPPQVQKECWGPLSQKPAPPWKCDRRGSPTPSDPQQTASDPYPESSAAASDQPAVTSWANVASQPPKKPAEKTISNKHTKKEEISADQDEASGKKKRKKKKKKKSKGGEDEEAEIEVTTVYQEPPKFEDEEEFPGLSSTVASKMFTGGTAVKLCNEENQRESFQAPFPEQNKEKPPAAKSAPSETAKKTQKAEKVSGKKSKAPVQLDIGNVLAALEKKQQSQKAKQDAKPIIFSVGGGLPMVQKQTAVQKKTPKQQDKIAHNPLDSTSPLVKKGKQREVPRAKKPTPLKKIILKEREERKQRRLLEEMGLLPENEVQPPDEAQEEEQCDTNITEEVGSPAEEDEEQTEVNGTEEVDKEGEEEESAQESNPNPTSNPNPNPDPDLNPASRPKIHSRKFRDYCSQMLSKDLDKCVTDLLKELVRFQDRLYQKDPMKARMKRRIVMGLREVLKHLKLRKVKCVVISPNCERIQSKGGLDEALYTIIDTCREQGVPFVFALSRKALGRCVNKTVPVSLVGIFNYDGAQDFYHTMIELSSEARKAYEVMVSSLEQTEDEEAVNAEEDLKISGVSKEAEPAQSEEPDYIKTWKKMLEKDYNHKFLNFEEQLSSMHLDSDCTDISDELEKS